MSTLEKQHRSDASQRLTSLGIMMANWGSPWNSPYITVLAIAVRCLRGPLCNGDAATERNVYTTHHNLYLTVFWQQNCIIFLRLIWCWSNWKECPTLWGSTGKRTTCQGLLKRNYCESKHREILLNQTKSNQSSIKSSNHQSLKSNQSLIFSKKIF